MDFSSWKKKCEDGKTCTLVHPKGHTMTIAVKALPKLQQEAIKRLKFADGGEVDGMSEQGKDVRHSNGKKERKESDGREEMEQAKEEAKGRAEMERMVKPKIKGLAEGGEVKYGNPQLAEKGRSQLKEKYSETPEQKKKADTYFSEADRELKNTGHGPMRKNYDEGGVTSSSDDSSDNSSQPPGNHTPITINVGTPQPQQAQMSTGSATPPMAPPMRSPAQAQTPMQQPTSLEGEAQKTLNAANQGNEGIEQQKQIDIQKAQAAAPAVQEQLEGLESVKQAQAAALQEVNRHTQDFNSYIQANPIDPKHYQESMGSGEKTATAIGLFLGGMGVPFGGHNFAFDHLQKQIDRDISAQQQRTENQKTVLGAYQQLYGDSNISTNLAKASMNDIYAKKIEQAAIQLGTPQAIANANMAKAKFNTENAQLRMNAAGLLAGSRMAPRTQTTTKGAPQAANDWYENHVLSPNADSISKTLQYNPMASQNLPAIQEQKSRADLADKALATINEKFPNLSKEAGEGSYARNHLAPFVAGTPFIGSSLAHAVNTFTDTQNTRNYESDKSAVVGAVRGALQGNVSDELLDSTVGANLPDRNDSPETAAKKIKTLKEFIKSHTKTDLLRQFNLSKD